MSACGGGFNKLSCPGFDGLADRVERLAGMVLLQPIAQRRKIAAFVFHIEFEGGTLVFLRSAGAAVGASLKGNLDFSPRGKIRFYKINLNT